MVPHYLTGLVYSALVQSYASEHSARMEAMDSATRNAEEMIDDLSLELNHARQSQITQEIAEIISGNPDQGASL
ncbi:ATP synthase gamma chain [bioreactor metagenome]|uniref:ATP synthase gamma chain n=1 Tax=bioreactor metagenome TaxID=1076179 RepID=A0A645I9J1_9ZZZZ